MKVPIEIHQLRVSLPHVDGKRYKTIHAVFENGVFRPVESADLPEKKVP